IGLNPLRLKIIFFTLLSACTVAALQTVGAILVIAMVVTPGATAYLLTDQFKRLLIISVTIGTCTKDSSPMTVSLSAVVFITYRIMESQTGLGWKGP
ncbi:metal ABC transporter permease, partial [Escherichia coli]|uniref:metal ABC transporter permease n=1 Tax=Escherichia coli TaxID=562 RepID=UPI003D819861